MRVLLLVGGAGAVIGTAAALSSLAARNPELPAGRWSAPLPALLVKIADARVTRVLLHVAGLVATIAGIIALATRDVPTNGLVAIPVLTVVSLVAGPVYRLVNPVRMLAAQGGVPTEQDARNPPQGRQRDHGAALWLIALCLIALSTRDPRLLAATTGGYVVLQSVLMRLQPDGRSDAVETLSALLGHLAPIGRDEHRRLVWRNPLVAVSHVQLPPGVVDAGAVVIAVSLAHAVWHHPNWRTAVAVGGGVAVVLLFGVALVVAVAVLRLCLIRPFFRSATVPLVAAYGVVAAGPWWRPVDLLVFVALHVVAIGVLHRQAIARHDLRTARAVQFPLRVALVTSVVGGLALLAGQ